MRGIMGVFVVVVVQVIAAGNDHCVEQEISQE
jgi:hypothetical protein